MKEQDRKELRLPGATVLEKKIIGLARAVPAEVNVAPLADILAFPTQLIQGAVVFCCSRARVRLALQEFSKRTELVVVFCVRIH
jgi:hypothetical protein